MTTLQQVLDAGGPDPARLATACQIVGMGTMLTPQRRSLTGLTSAATFKLTDLVAGMPGIRVGGTAISTAGGVASAKGPMIAIGSPAVLLGSAGYTIGSGDGAVRLIPKAGFIVRWAQFSGAGTATTGPTYYRASQSLAVFSTGEGTVVEIWVQLATNASGVATSTAAQVKAAILANANAMRALSSVDFNGGTGASAAGDQAPKDAPFGLYAAQVTAAGASAPKTIAPGSFFVSHDGNLVAFPDALTGVDLDYFATPRVPLEEPYPSSA